MKNSHKNNGDNSTKVCYMEHGLLDVLASFQFLLSAIKRYEVPIVKNSELPSRISNTL